MKAINELIKLYFESEYENEILEKSCEAKEIMIGEKILKMLKKEGYEFGRNPEVEFVDISKEDAYRTLNGRKHRVIREPMFVNYDHLDEKGDWKRTWSYLP